MEYKIKGITPRLETVSLDKTIKFYEKHFGFKCTGKFEEHAFLSKDEQTILFTSMSESHGQKKPFMTGSVYIYTEEVDEVYNAIKDALLVAYPLETHKSGMREFGVYDNNGYMIQFGKSVGTGSN